MRTGGLIAAVAAVSVGLSGCGFAGLYGANLPGGSDLGSHPYAVNIYFTNVMDLVPQSAVKVNDVSVGKVTAIRLTGPGDTDSGDVRTNGWTARVTIEVNGSVNLPNNARAAVKMTSLLGEKYVDLEQPTIAATATRLHNGSTIPITSTGTAPEVEEVLGALSLLLNGGGLNQIRIITSELNQALKGNEGAVRDLLAQLNTFVGTLDKQKNNITIALESIDKLAASLNQQKQSIVNALATFPQALQILSSERTKIVTMLGALSNLGTTAADVIGATQNDLVTSLKMLQPAVEALAASGQDLPQALKIAATFPFPIGKTLDLARGDYANLSVKINLNLQDELCGLNVVALCTLSKLVPTSAAATPVGSAHAGPSSTAPILIGLGR